MMHKHEVPRQVLSAVGAAAGCALLLLVVLSNVRSDSPTVLLPSVGLNPASELKGTPFMPESIPWKFPHPYSEHPAGHPTLSSVEYMPQDSMSWYPDQPASNSTNSTDAEEGEGSGETMETEENAEPEEASEETDEAAEAAVHTSMLAMKQAGATRAAHSRLPDPAEWLKNKMVTGAMMGNGHKGRIPDPVEWLGSKVLGTSNFARRKHAAHRMKTLQKAINPATTGTAKLSQIRSSPGFASQDRQMTKFAMVGGFSSPNGASVSDATDRAKILGCSGVHYITSGGLMSAHPCKSQQQEMSALEGAKFTRGDLGTTLEGATTDFSGREFKHAYNGENAADYMDNRFLAQSAKPESQKLARGSTVNLFGNKADMADDQFLQSTMNAHKQHAARKESGSAYTKYKTW